MPKNRNTGYPFPFIFSIMIGGKRRDAAIAAWLKMLAIVILGAGVIYAG